MTRLSLLLGLLFALGRVSTRLITGKQMTARTAIVMTCRVTDDLLRNARRPLGNVGKRTKQVHGILGGEMNMLCYVHVPRTASNDG